MATCPYTLDSEVQTLPSLKILTFATPATGLHLNLFWSIQPGMPTTQKPEAKLQHVMRCIWMASFQHYCWALTFHWALTLSYRKLIHKSCVRFKEKKIKKKKRHQGTSLANKIIFQLWLSFLYILPGSCLTNFKAITSLFKYSSSFPVVITF